LIKEQVATFGGIADVFCTGSEAAGALAEDPAGAHVFAVMGRLKPCQRKESTLAEINRLLWLLFLKRLGVIFPGFVIDLKVSGGSVGKMGCQVGKFLCQVGKFDLQVGKIDSYVGNGHYVKVPQPKHLISQY
jgi:hypothetical protein